MALSLATGYHLSMKITCDSTTRPLISNASVSSVAMALIFVSALFVTPLCASADTYDIGGGSERFKGGGDQTPPECQFDVPRSATEPFFIKWNCTDDVSDPDQITTELWFLKNGAEVPVKFASFLGFPASVQFNAQNLEADDVASGLPAAFRLIARDRAGVATISPFVIVSAQDNSLDQCTVSVVREGTESSGGTTGTPSTSILISNIDVTTQQGNNTSVRIMSDEVQSASPCEIESLCDESQDNAVRFDSTVQLSVISGSTTSDGSRTVTGGINLSPGSVSASDLTGTGTVQNSVLTALSASATTFIDGVETEIDISCSQN